MRSIRMRSLRSLESNQMKMIVAHSAAIKLEENKAFICLSMAFLQT